MLRYVERTPFRPLYLIQYYDRRNHGLFLDQITFIGFRDSEECLHNYSNLFASESDCHRNFHSHFSVWNQNLSVWTLCINLIVPIQFIVLKY